MPFKIVKEKQGYRLFNLHKDAYAKPVFKSRKTAISAGSNFIRYRERKKSKVVGNKIIPI